MANTKFNVGMRNSNLQQKSNKQARPQKATQTAESQKSDNIAKTKIDAFPPTMPLKEVAKIVKQDLIKNLTFLSTSNNYAIMNKSFFSHLERSLSENNKLYEDDEKRKDIASRGIQGVTGKVTDNDIAIDIIKRYIFNPFGIFDFILKLRASDIFVVKDKISFTETNNESALEIVIPEALRPMWYKFVDRFIMMTIYDSDLHKTKFERVNAILDYQSSSVRFNVVHESLNANKSGRPIIALRNQLLDFNKASMEETKAFSKKYIAGQKLTKTQLAFINKLAFEDSFLIFGETGSGKSTLLKYMGGYRVEEKRNLITIEDTPELFLPVNIAYLTNETFKVKDLFDVSLRENPSHLIVGESRKGQELKNILESGLVFSCGTTLHANSLEKVITRIIFLVKDVGSQYSTDDIATLVCTVFAGFIWMKNRKICEIWKRKDNIEDYADALHNYELVK